MDAKALVKVNYSVPNTASMSARQTVEAHMARISFAQTLAQLQAKQIIPLAVTTKKRSPGAPDLPTMEEAGVAGYEVAGWYGVLAPAKTPRQIIDKLNKEIVRILHGADVASRLAADGSEPVGSTPEQFAEFLKKEIARWGKVVKDNAIRAD